ncbi:hypothetical protein D3C72_1876050 [compost metagenome]
MRHVVRREIDQAVGKLEGLGVAELEGRGVVEFAGLFADRLGDLRAAVAGIDAPEAGGAVEHLAAVMGRIVHVLGADEEARFLLELAVCRERHPEGAQVVGRCIQAVRHQISPWPLCFGRPFPGWRRICRIFEKTRTN